MGEEITGEGQAGGGYWEAKFLLCSHFPWLCSIIGDDGGHYRVICAALRMCWFGAGVSELSVCSLDEDEGLKENGLYLF